MSGRNAPTTARDARWMDAAAGLAMRAGIAARPNPTVGCVLVAPDGRVVGAGATAPGGRPHAEAAALAMAGSMARSMAGASDAQAARGATAYVTLEPCAHDVGRGGPCAEALVAAGVARVVIGHADPDPRTAGRGADRLAGAGIAVAWAPTALSARSLADWLLPMALGRPLVTLKLATSLDGRIALADGTSRWISGPAARAQAHGLRARVDAVLVGRGTLAADAPRLDVRLPGHPLPGATPPRRILLSRSAEGVPAGWERIGTAGEITGLAGVRHVLVEGGAGAAAAMLAADLVDRLVWIHAPIVLGDGRRAVEALGDALPDLGAAHGRWRLVDERMLGPDRMATYERADGRLDFGAPAGV